MAGCSFRRLSPPFAGLGLFSSTGSALATASDAAERMPLVGVAALFFFTKKDAIDKAPAARLPDCFATFDMLNATFTRQALSI